MPKCPASKQLKHHKLSLRKTSNNICHNIYKLIIQIRFIVLDFRTYLQDYIF